MTLRNPTMPLLSNEHGSGNISQDTTHVMYGTSPGEVALHDPEHVPLDTVVYMALIAQYRKRIGAKGMLYIDTNASRWGTARGRQALVDHRTDVLCRAASHVDPGIRIVLDKDLANAGLSGRELPDDVLKRIQSQPCISGKQRQYTAYQTDTVRGCMDLANTGAGQFGKGGWYVDHRYDMAADRDVYSGGEATFDRLLPASWQISSHYVLPGYRLQPQYKYEPSANALALMPAEATAPYLLQKGHADRIRLVENLADIDEELACLRPGVTRAGVEMTRAACAVILRKPDLGCTLERLHQQMWTYRRDIVTDPGELDEVTGELRDALSRLLP